MAKQEKINYLRLDKINSADYIESVVNKTAPLLAGHFVKLGKVVNPAQGEVVECTLAASGTDYDALVAPVYIDQGFSDFVEHLHSVPAGKPARALILEPGSIVSFAKDQVKGAQTGDKVEIGDDGFGLKKAASGDGIGEVIAEEPQRVVGGLVVVRFK